MDALKIIGLSIVAAILYGVVHDQVTAHVCVEYFTIGHPPVFATESPTLLGIDWGIIATWWVGALLGGPLALAAIRGPRPRRSAGSLVRPIGLRLVFMGLCGRPLGAFRELPRGLHRWHHSHQPGVAFPQSAPVRSRQTRQCSRRAPGGPRLMAKDVGQSPSANPRAVADGLVGEAT